MKILVFCHFSFFGLDCIVDPDIQPEETHSDTQDNCIEFNKHWIGLVGTFQLDRSHEVQFLFPNFGPTLPIS